MQHLYNALQFANMFHDRISHQFYVGIDIGASFHVASCIKFDSFLDPKGGSWKRIKMMKFNSDSAVFQGLKNK